MLVTHTPMLNTDFIVTSIGLALQIALLTVLLTRRLYRHFPLFSFYTTYSVVITVLELWFMTHFARSYFSLYWTTEAISGVLELLVLHEAFMPSLRIDYGQLRWLRLLPPSILLITTGWALWWAVYHPVGRGPFVHFAAGAYAFELAVHLLEVAVFLLALRLARRQYHPIRNPYRLGIVLGFGCIASAVLLPD